MKGTLLSVRKKRIFSSLLLNPPTQLVDRSYSAYKSLELVRHFLDD